MFIRYVAYCADSEKSVFFSLFFGGHDCAETPDSMCTSNLLKLSEQKCHFFVVNEDFLEE